jgi:hypothetical protein
VVSRGSEAYRCREKDLTRDSLCPLGHDPGPPALAVAHEAQDFSEPMS